MVEGEGSAWGRFNAWVCNNRFMEEVRKNGMVGWN